jgi:hypothetical protein
MSRHCWTIAAALAAAIVAAMGSPAARADGDPASDVLLVRSVFLPYESLSPAVGGDLQRAVSAVYLHGDRVKVAAIYEKEDLGAIPSLFGQPAQYAQFLGIELGLWYVGPLLVVMPNGFGVYDGGRPVAAAQQVLRSLSVAGGTPDDLVRSATTAVQHLAAAGALSSPDIRAPLVTAYPATAIRGKSARLHFDVFDDSGRARSLVRIYENGALVATRIAPSLFQIGTRHVQVRWPVPLKLRSRQLRFCVVATDPAGNRSRPACAPFLRVS